MTKVRDRAQRIKQKFPVSCIVVFWWVSELMENLNQPENVDIAAWFYLLGFFLSLQFVLDSVENSLFLSELPWELFQGQCW